MSRIPARAALLCLTAVLLAACGGQGSDGTSTTGTDGAVPADTTPAASEPAETPVAELPTSWTYDSTGGLDGSWHIDLVRAPLARITGYQAESLPDGYKAYYDPGVTVRPTSTDAVNGFSGSPEDPPLIVAFRTAYAKKAKPMMEGSGTFTCEPIPGADGYCADMSRVLSQNQGGKQLQPQDWNLHRPYTIPSGATGRASGGRFWAMVKAKPGDVAVLAYDLSGQPLALMVENSIYKPVME